MRIGARGHKQQKATELSLASFSEPSPVTETASSTLEGSAHTPAVRGSNPRCFEFNFIIFVLFVIFMYCYLCIFVLSLVNINLN